MLNLLNLILIEPLALIIEITYTLMYYLLGSAGTAIPAVSLVVNLLVLPLYMRADSIQAEERARTARMAPGISHIKNTFSGKEQYMLLNAYYRVEHYTPLSSMRTTLSLLLQIPFFIAAYNYLSSLPILAGASFLGIPDLGAPDGILFLFGLRLNLLPILMTLINVFSGIVYLKGAPLREKLQTYGLATVFLILLYNSPAGLVLYWTCNQIFSLGKNIVMQSFKTASKKRSGLRIRSNRRNCDTTVFITSALFLTVLLGLLIPSALIASSTQEFMDPVTFVNPLRYIGATFAVSFGLCVIWGGVLYYLASAKIRHHIAFIFFLLGLTAVVTYMFFGKELGVISPELIFDKAPRFDTVAVLLNIAVLLFICLVFFFVRTKKPAVLPYCTVVLLIGILGLSVPNLITIQSEAALAANMIPAIAGSHPTDTSLQSTGSSFAAGNTTTGASASAGESASSSESATGNTADTSDHPAQTSGKVLHLSKTKKNIVVIMLDRFIGGYVPYLMQEKPALLEQFKGFTYYHNTLAHGTYTNFASPSLFGGYEYTPDKMNERDTELLKDKHDEALRVLPKLFGESGYEVTVCDPPYAGYTWIPDLSIYKGMKNVTARNLERTYNHTIDPSLLVTGRAPFERNLFMYAVFKTFPVFLQAEIYDNGNYLSLKNEIKIRKAFIDAYAVLLNLTKITDASSAYPSQLILLNNNTTHEPVRLQLPDYNLQKYVNNKTWEKASRFTLPDGSNLMMNDSTDYAHYEIDMAALLRLGEWFDELRALGVYDNTRIIVVSDHGRQLAQFEELLVDDKWDAERANALLMVKDFDSHEDFKTSEEFMTIADVPMLVTTDLIENPKNPYTGNPITNKDKYAHDQLVTTSHKFDRRKNNGKVFITNDRPWYSVHDNIWNKENWTRLEDEPSEK